MKSPTQILFLSLLALCISFSTQAQNALHFDGLDDMVDCGNGSEVNISGSSFTLEAWIYAESWELNVWQGNIINKEQNGAGTDYGYMLRVGAGGKLNANFGNGSWKEVTSTNAVLTLNTWHHIAGRYNGSYLTIYVDGIPVDSSAYSGSINSGNSNLVIGAQSNGGRHFTGSIDEVRIWDVARTKSQIQQNMHTLQCADETGLKAYYRFDQGIAGGNNAGQTTANDSRGQSHGTLQNFSLNGASSNWLASTLNFIPQFQSYNQTDTICHGEVLAFGNQMLTSPGIYTDTIPSNLSCDSVITLDLKTKSIDNSIILSNDTLWAVDTSLSYSWVDCNNLFRTIPGATNRYYVPFINTRYAVIVSDGECVDTSDCININIGLDELPKDDMEIFPNPFHEKIVLDYKGRNEIKSLKIINLTGQVVFEWEEINQDKIELNTESLAKGIYQIQWFDVSSTKFSRKIIKF
jgi:hypothetical protein